MSKGVRSQLAMVRPNCPRSALRAPRRQPRPPLQQRCEGEYQAASAPLCYSWNPGAIPSPRVRGNTESQG